MISLDESLEIGLNHDNINSNNSLSTQSFFYYDYNEDKSDNCSYCFDKDSNYHNYNNFDNKKYTNYILKTLKSSENDKNQKKNDFQKEIHEKNKIIENKQSIEDVTKNIFQTSMKKSRGVQSNISRNRRHINLSFDNLQTKIQVHFFSFIINICNDALNTELHFNNKCFKGISYDKKRYFNYQLFEEYQKSPIWKFLTFNISKKYKNFQKDHNLKLLSKVYYATNWLNKFFNINYLKLFEFYFNYNKEKQMNNFNFEGKNINLSKNTKTFCDLLKKKENEGIKKELIDAAVSVYFHDYDLIKQSKLNNYHFSF